MRVLAPVSAHAQPSAQSLRVVQSMLTTFSCKVEGGSPKFLFLCELNPYAKYDQFILNSGIKTKVLENYLILLREQEELYDLGVKNIYLAF